MASFKAENDALLYINRLESTLDLYDAAADKFIKKVEAGEAHSRVTYADLKAAREDSRKARE